MAIIRTKCRGFCWGAANLVTHINLSMIELINLKIV